MQVSISEIKAKMTSLLEVKGYAESDIPFLMDMYLGGELRGHTSHGLASFIGFAKKEKPELPEPEVIKATVASFYIDAKSNSGTLVGKRAADEAIARARKEITGTAIIKNMDSWLRPGAIAEYIADQGFVALVMNSGGGAAVTPVEAFTIQEDEVEQVKWFTRAELESELRNHPEKYLKGLDWAVKTL